MEGLSLLYSGSVKNIWTTSPDELEKKSYVFEYSDAYSVFDWGRMPDHLEGKGESLAAMAWFFFEVLGTPSFWRDWNEPSELKDSTLLKIFRVNGMRHHCKGLVSKTQKTLADQNISNFLSVNPVDVHWPEALKVDGELKWDYTAYESRPVNSLVPLEVIFRFGVPAGSSLLKRVKNEEYCKEIGLTKAPVVGDRFNSPIIEYSTKLETTDRYISISEAKDIASLTENESKKLHEMVTLLSLRLKDVFDGIGVELWDGKFEFGFAPETDINGEREFLLVDSIGPDELRLTYEGVQLSKENLRGCYRSTEWCQAIEKAKTMATERGEKDWKKICLEELNSKPPQLDDSVLTKASMIYKSLGQSLFKKYLNRDIYPDAWKLEDLANSWR